MRKFLSLLMLLGAAPAAHAQGVSGGGVSGVTASPLPSTAFFATAPTLTAGFCTNPSVSKNNGTAAFEITVGSACAAGTGTITLPAATNAWICTFADITTPATHSIIQTGGSSTTVTVQDYARSNGATQNMVAADVIRASCVAY